MNRGDAWSLAFVILLVAIVAFYVLLSSRPTYWV